MLSSVELGSLVTYLAGSALSSEDLKRADAQSALAVFFLSNAIVNEEGAVLDDAANVLRVLSVTNFNSQLKTYAQIITRKDRNVLKNSQVDVVICLDEYRTSIQARNAVCPGISTLIENLFHTFGEFDGGGSSQAASGPSGNVPTAMGWLDEYIAGAEMEVYYVPLSLKYVQKMGCSWSLMAEGVYLEFGAMLIGVCSSRENNLLLCPSRVEINQYPNVTEFFDTYNTAIVICESYEEGMKLSRGLEDDLVINRIMSKLTFAEDSFKVRTPLPPMSRRLLHGGALSNAGSSSSSSEGLSGGVGGLTRGLSFVSTSSLKKLTSTFTATTSGSSSNNSKGNLLKPTGSDGAMPAVARSSSVTALLGQIQLINRENNNNNNNSKKASSSDLEGENNSSSKKSKLPIPLRRFSKEWLESLSLGAISKASPTSSPSSKAGATKGSPALLSSALTLVAFANESEAKESFIKTLAAYEETNNQEMEEALMKARLSMGSISDMQSRHERTQLVKSFQGYLVPDEEGGLGVSDFMTEAGNSPLLAHEYTYPL